MNVYYFVYSLGSFLGPAVPSYICTFPVSSACNACKGSMSCFYVPKSTPVQETGDMSQGAVEYLRIEFPPSFVHEKAGSISEKVRHGGIRYTSTRVASFAIYRSLFTSTLCVDLGFRHFTRLHSFSANSFGVVRAAKLRSWTVELKQINRSVTFSCDFQ